MTRWNGWSKFQAVMRAELLHLTTINASDRRWQMPFAAALASGLPLLVGAYFDRMDYGLISSLGGLVFLYLPKPRVSPGIKDGEWVTSTSLPRGIRSEGRFPRLESLGEDRPWTATCVWSGCTA
jgi:hypothetical protein